ncbi:MAG: ATP-binding protein [Bacteroidales bacterium]|jgi:signal transduction histidine kinase|nr:histidine kinase [Bacteroidales bacterium]MDD2263393.1 histidine kinase [Bacteroidales bacterium]MDD2830817.1 histidine kinase [Bacteroidales bacterium]MDD3208016.1 histidine kinase [Bacteroidales bacterium]MDD3696477.1 histidine kinase [Bacteroidales bacterium]
MIFKIALFLSMIIQLGTAIVAVSMVRRTKYNISWILISVAFVMMALERLFEFSSFFWETKLVTREEVNSWLGIVISVLMLISLYYIRQIFNLQDQLDSIRKHSEKRLLMGIIQGEERARQAIAGDLHDGLGPLLSSVKMIISAADTEKMDPENRKIVEQSYSVIDEAIVSLREISNDLSPHLLKNYGLVKAIGTMTGQLFGNSGKKLEMNSSIGRKRYDYDLEINIYRIVSELLNNSLKHAEADTICLDIRESGGVFMVDYRDNGKGMVLTDDPVERQGMAGMGMENIYSRVKSLDGFVTMHSAPGEGFGAYIEIPLK